MAKIISTLSDAITFLNSLYEQDSTAPSSGDEDYTVWTALLNVAVNVWETEEGVLWNELFAKLSSALDGDKTATPGDYSYACPTDFVFPSSGIVWIGSGVNKTPFKVIKREEKNQYEINADNWCYFLTGNSPTLEFNPNCTIPSGTINYEYYKTATKLTSSSDKFDMSDPMFAVYYALSELRKDEGDTAAAAIATQKLESMKTKNLMTAHGQSDQIINQTDDGFGN